MKKTIEFRLDRSRLSVFDSSRYPVQKASNGVPFIDVPALGFYAGTHKGTLYTSAHIKSLEKTFKSPDPSDELFGTVPVMIDHSDSNRDKCGHIRSVHTVGDESHIVIRVVGDEAIKQVQEGKFRTLSAGISVYSEGEEEEVKHPESEPDGDESMSEGDPIKQECEDEKTPDAECSEELPEDQVYCCYDHMAFTPFPALQDCKLYQRAPVVEKEISALKRATALLSSAKAEASPEDILKERRSFAKAETENLIHRGKVTPAQREFFTRLLTTMDADQRDCFVEYMRDHAPKATPVGEALGQQYNVRPEQQKPIQGAAEKESLSRLSRITSLFQRGQVKQ